MSFASLRSRSSLIIEPEPHEMPTSDSSPSSTAPLLNTSKTSKVILYTYDEVPIWQQDNHYILTGYVRETLSLKKCWDSLFYIHNETVNILTHLLPGLILPVFLLILTPVLKYLAPDLNKGQLFRFIPASIVEIPIYDIDSNSSIIKDELLFGLFFFGFSTCLSCSATFHTLKCHSYLVASVGSQIDYVGIIALIVTSMVGIIYYSLFDAVKACYFFLILVFSIGFICLVITLNPEFKEPHWRPFRATMFVIFGVSAVFPIFYGYYSFGWTEVYNRAGLGWVLLEGVGYISGAALYGMRVPERFSPGKYDIYGNSHQIFHVLVVLSALSHFRGLVESYKYCHENLI